MNERKIFGIGAVILMLLVAVAPAINGLQLEKSGYLEPPKSTTYFGDFSVVITRCEFVEYSQTEDKVKYEIDWIVWWELGIFGETFNCKLYEKTNNTVYANWDVQFYLGGPTSNQGTVALWLTSSEDPSVDQERNLAGRMIVFEIYVEDLVPSNNVAEQFVKYWKEDSDYIPTDPQVEVSAPRWGNKVYHPELPNLYYVDILGGNGGRILSNILLSRRMGWAGQALGHLAKISADLATIFGTIVAFLISIQGDIGVLGTWFLDVLLWFENLISGIWIPGKLVELINNFIDFVGPAIKDIGKKGVLYGGVVAAAAIKLWEDANATYYWTLDNPWTKKIRIDVTVDRVKAGETVTVQCRNHTEVKTRDEPMGEGSLHFNFEVESGPQGYELSQEGIHNCQVKVSGSKHDGEINSRRLLSYAFANGSLNWQFSSPNGKTRSRDLSEQTFVDKLINWMKNRPILSLLEKIVKKNKIAKEIEQRESSLNKDSNLETLMKKVKEEKYEPYEGLEYRPYYSGAPRDPNVVYYSSDQVVVGFKSYVDITQIDEVEGYPVVDKIPELNTVIVEIYGIDPVQFIEIVENMTDVEYAELDYVYHSYFTPNDPLWDSQWGPKAINCPEAWDVEKGSVLVNVAIVDTGCNYNHEDIKCKESYVNYDFVNNDDDPMDDNGHGTHCAGIIGATMNNDLGIAGVSQSFTDYIKVLDGGGAGYTSTVAKGIVHAAKSPNTVDIISMSLGGYGISVLVHAACDYAYYIKGVLLVAAAGNDGLRRVGYPARFESVIAVGAVDENLKLCSWSNYGPDVDLVAPGENIISTIGNNHYERLSGTSMACPHVAGVAALYLSKNSDATAVLCKGKLFSSAIDLGSPGKDIYYGYGLVNAYGAVSKKAITRDKLPHLLDFTPKLKQFITNSQLLQQIIKTLSK